MIWDSFWYWYWYVRKVFTFSDSERLHHARQIQPKQACQKEFPSHSKLTPGLYWLTCGCTQKTIYGFSMMLSGESPAMLFDLVMTRFEHNYDPHIIYDASCIAKEFGYNRKLRRFMQLSITSDRFHEVNHKSCSNSFKTSEYNQLEKINSEAWNRLTLP